MDLCGWLENSRTHAQIAERHAAIESGDAEGKGAFQRSSVDQIGEKEEAASRLRQKTVKGNDPMGARRTERSVRGRQAGGATNGMTRGETRKEAHTEIG